VTKVLIAGQEILVGQSTRSNEAAVSSLQKVFPDIPVLGIPVSGTLHLKSVITVAEEGVLVTSKTTAAQQILKVHSFLCCQHLVYVSV
jgi:N-dimethylarginine dimethylaminohydrolase